jgi:processive 1,2-diacylglycerol beta-glucosyltransferase
VDKTVSLLADALDDVQLLAIAGRNEKLHEALRSAAAGCPHGRRVPGVGDPCGRGGKIVPFGFVTNMHELMAACDFAVTKSGGLTSSECLAMGLPMVILSPIPGQEERNSDYLLENGAALRANSAAHLVFKVGKLLKDGALLARMASAARAIARPRAAYDIAAEVMGEV